MSDKPRARGTTRREVLTKAAFVAPAILSLAAAPSFASAGSRAHDPHDRDEHEKKHDKRGGDDD